MRGQGAVHTFGTEPVAAERLSCSIEHPASASLHLFSVLAVCTSCGVHPMASPARVGSTVAEESARSWVVNLMGFVY